MAPLNEDVDTTHALQAERISQSRDKSRGLGKLRVAVAIALGACVGVFSLSNSRQGVRVEGIS